MLKPVPLTEAQIENWKKIYPFLSLFSDEQINAFRDRLQSDIDQLDEDLKSGKITEEEL